MFFLKISAINRFWLAISCSLTPSPLHVLSVYICIYFIIFFFSIFCDCDAHTGGYIHRRKMETESSVPSPTESLWSISQVLGWCQKIWNSVNSTLAGAWKGDDGGSALAPLKVNSEGPGGMMPLFTETQILSNQWCPQYTNTHSHQNPLQSLYSSCERFVCQSQQPGPNPHPHTQSSFGRTED